MRNASDGRHNIHQEEWAYAKRPDFRVHGNGFDTPFPAELKLAEKWSGPDLFERPENQLCSNCLGVRRSNRGIFVIVHLGGQETWKIPGKCKKVGFDELIRGLQKHWSGISSEFPGVDEITVVGIDLSNGKTK